MEPLRRLLFTRLLSCIFSLYFTIDMQNCKEHIENLYIKHLLSGIQGSKILNQLAEILKKVYHFYNVSQKQICNVHVFTPHAVVLPVSAIILPHTGAIDCTEVYVPEIFHASVCCVTYGDFHSRTKVKTRFNFVLGFFHAIGSFMYLANPTPHICQMIGSLLYYKLEYFFVFVYLYPYQTYPIIMVIQPGKYVIYYI